MFYKKSYDRSPLPSCTNIPRQVKKGMESSAPRYHLEINGITEGPMTAREMAWKIGMASADDVVLYRREESEQWTPREGNIDQIHRLATSEDAAEIPAALPPKLKLKKREEETHGDATRSPVPFHISQEAAAQGFDSAPPPPGGSGNIHAFPGLEHTDDNPPPPPGAPGYPAPTPGVHAGVPPPPQPGNANTGTTQAPFAPSAPSAPPVRVSSLLMSAFVITLGLVGYIFFLMKQDVAGSARRQAETSSNREIKDLRYTVLTKAKALEWKESAKARLTAFGEKAKVEAAASEARSMAMIKKAEQIRSQYSSEARSLYQACAHARFLSIAYDQNSAQDIKALRRLELAVESAEAHLPPGTRADLKAGRFASVAMAAKSAGLESLVSAFEITAKPLEARLAEELVRIRPLAEEAAGFARKNMYVVPDEIVASAVGSSDALGLFDINLAPGDYFLIGASDLSTEAPTTVWAQALQVRPLVENTLRLNEGNLGNIGPDSLWKPDETRVAERDILSIKRQAERISEALKSLQALRETFSKLDEEMAGLIQK